MPSLNAQNLATMARLCCREMIVNIGNADLLEVIARWSEMDGKMVQKGCLLAWNL